MIFEEGQGGYKKNPQRAAFFYEESVLEDEVEGMIRLGRLHCVHDTSRGANQDVEPNNPEEWADFTYGIEMLNQAVSRGHADAYDLLDQTVQQVASTYENMQDFRHQIARRAAAADELCVALQAALDALLVYQEEQEPQGGLTPEQIKKIKSKTLKKKIKGERCCICLGDFEKKDKIRELPCKHMFHKDCVDEWLGQNRKCPLCKT